MRTLAMVTVLAACGATPSPPPEMPVREDRDPPCLPYVERSVRARTDGGAVLLEQVTSPSSCGGGGPQTVSPLARIALPSSPTECPIGQLAVRMWSRGHGSENTLPAFVAALDSSQHAALRQQMMYFAEGTQAYVIDCPSKGHADFVLVETTPVNDRPRIELFVGSTLLPMQAHPRVTFLGGDGAALQREAPPPSSAPPPKTGDCSESLAQGRVRWLGRAIITGEMPGPSNLRTYAIGRDGDKVTIVIQHQISNHRKGERFAWRCEESTTLTGTASQQGKTLVFHVADGKTPGEPIDVTCTPRDLRVARANAVRVAIPSTMEGCKANRWARSPNVTQRALACTIDGTQLFVSAAPGLEHVTLDEDDCGDPTLALRVIARDGAVAPVRASR